MKNIWTASVWHQFVGKSQTRRPQIARNRKTFISNYWENVQQQQSKQQYQLKIKEQQQ